MTSLALIGKRVGTEAIKTLKFDQNRDFTFWQFFATKGWQSISINLEFGTEEYTVNSLSHASSWVV